MTRSPVTGLKRKVPPEAVAELATLSVGEAGELSLDPTSIFT